MSKILSKLLALIAFLLCIAALAYFKAWWPGILLAIGIPLALWQILQGRHFDMLVTLFVTIGAFLSIKFKIRWEVLVPGLLATGGIYIFLREYFKSKNDDDK